jgi:hypothetical protein
MHDDFGRRYPSVALACGILAAATANARPLDIRVGLAGLTQLRECGLTEGFGNGIPAADAALHIEAAALDWIASGDVGHLLDAPALAPLVVHEAAGVGRLLRPERCNAVREAIQRTLGWNTAPAAMLLTGLPMSP